MYSNYGQVIAADNIDHAIFTMLSMYMDSGEGLDEDAFLDQQIQYWTMHHEKCLSQLPGRGNGLNLLWEFDKVHHVHPADVFPKAICIGELKAIHEIFLAVENTPRQHTKDAVKIAVKRLQQL